MVRRPTHEAAVKRPDRYFRAGVGIVIVNARGRVLVLERSDIPGAWQLPQGGLEQGEEPLDAALREVREETGISREKLELLGRHPEPLVYELPPTAQSPKTGSGQVQYWFFFKYREEDADIRLPAGGEFRAWDWRMFDDVVAGAVEFRRSVYRRLREYFDTVGLRSCSTTRPPGS